MYFYTSSPLSMIVIFSDVLPDFDPNFSIFCTTFKPLITFPNTTCLLSSQSVLSVVMKNWEPLVLGPELAILRVLGPVCLNWKFSLANFEP